MSDLTELVSTVNIDKITDQYCFVYGCEGQPPPSERERWHQTEPRSGLRITFKSDSLANKFSELFDVRRLTKLPPPRNGIFIVSACSVHREKLAELEKEITSKREVTREFVWRLMEAT